MVDYTGSSNDDVYKGTADDDTLVGLGGNDAMSGEGGNDSLSGGEGNDTLYGDEGVGTEPGNDATALLLDIRNLVSDTSNGNNNADVGDVAVYKDVAFLEDGTSISARVILTAVSDPGLNVDLSGGDGYEILLNSGSGSSASDGGETATIRIEFFDPATGDAVALNSTATFNDLDRNSVGDQESVTLDANSFGSYGVASDSVLDVTTSPGSVNIAGTEANSPADQDSWFSAEFADRTFIEFTLETRSTQSGFTISGDLIDDPVVTPIEPGADTISGGGGQDVIFGQSGDDVLMGDGGDDSIYGGEGNDSLNGGQGQDILDAGNGADTIAGGAGDDTVYGGDGEDTISADADNDHLYGGNNSDTFTIDGAGNHVIVGGEDADGSDVDTLDLTAGRGTAYDHFRVTYANGDPEAGTVELLDANGNTFRRVQFSEIENVIICFTPGTKIATPAGEVAVETLSEGDRVFTRDNGIQEVRWVGRRDLTPSEMVKMPSYQPVLVRAGSLGNNLPETDLLLSPNHRVLMSDPKNTLYFDETEVLVAAKHLVDRDGIDQVGVANVSYVHVMFEQHQVILSNGAWTESFQPGDYSLKGVGDAQRNEIVGLFPELATDEGIANYNAARKLLKRHEAKLLA